MTPDDIRAHFDLQYQASRAHIDVPLLVRRERLLRVQKMLDEHGAVLAAIIEDSPMSPSGACSAPAAAFRAARSQTPGAAGRQR